MERNFNSFSKCFSWTIYKIENEDEPLMMAEFFDICRFLKITPMDFFGFNEEEYKTDEYPQKIFCEPLSFLARRYGRRSYLVEERIRSISLELTSRKAIISQIYEIPHRKASDQVKIQ